MTKEKLKPVEKKEENKTLSIFINLFDIIIIGVFAGFGFFWINFLIYKNIFMCIFLGCLFSTVASIYIFIHYLSSLKNKSTRRSK